jgi:threonine/homoserine/homoserine lactone efflux protein
MRSKIVLLANGTTRASMANNSEQSGFAGTRLAAPPGGILGKLLTIAAGAVLVVVAFMFSLLALTVVVIGGLLVFAYLKWKTRHLRRHLNEQMQQQANPQRQQPGGLVIEGEVIGSAEYDAKPRAAATRQAANDLPTRPTEPPGKTADG